MAISPAPCAKAWASPRAHREPRVAGRGGPGAPREAARGGRLGRVRAGDTTPTDLAPRRVAREAPPTELGRRRAECPPPPKLFARGWLQIYRRNVGPLSQGAVLTRNPP